MFGVPKAETGFELLFAGAETVDVRVLLLCYE